MRKCAAFFPRCSEVKSFVLYTGVKSFFSNIQGNVALMFVRIEREVLVIYAALCLLNYSWGDEESLQTEAPLEATTLEDSTVDLDGDASIWRFWQPWKLWNFGRNLMNQYSDDKSSYGRHSIFHQDHNKPKMKNKIKFLVKIHQFQIQRTITRRDSSLITTPKTSPIYGSSLHGPANTRVSRDSANIVVNCRPKGSVQRELVTLLFESMLKHVVESWEVIEPEKPEIDTEKTISEYSVSTKKKSKEHAKSGKTKHVSKDLSAEADQIEPASMPWWSGHDERAIIRFRNGNLYEGDISMKVMHGEGRFQWVDGSVYLGQFKNNEMVGKGMIQWKDDTWYQGEFLANVRHGRGLYVNSREQQSYVGGWHLGTKHGQGVMYYSRDFTNSYDGEWVKNVRHGIGSREYCHSSGYKGKWDLYLREGKGLMIWPNRDFYSGDWKNNVMSGFGVYIWDMYYNNSMSLPSINVFRGEWFKGKRNGYGVLNLGYGLGSHYKGEFKDNLKHGVGKLVTNNGQIFQHKSLFMDDNFFPHESEVQCTPKHPEVQNPIQFNICDSGLSLTYHVQEALINIDRQAEIRDAMIRDFIENNKYLEIDINTRRKHESPKERNLNIEDLIAFEETSLQKALQCYETELRIIYYKYATICNTEKIGFTPVLIRLYLWQLYFDCNVHEKGLTLVQIDNLFSRNPAWIAGSSHNPFEKIYFWQFLHSLITVASKLYAKRHFPGPKPDTILASAFRTFMEKDVLPSSNQNKGYLVNGLGAYVPLTGLYALYRSIGEPHTVRAFLCATLRPHHDRDHPQPLLVDPPDCCVPIGRNAYVIGDEMSFPVGENIRKYTHECSSEEDSELKLFNLGNLSCRTIVKIFAKIFPQVFGNNKILDLNVEITFYEFFEAFIACTEESVRLEKSEFRTVAAQTEP